MEKSQSKIGKGMFLILIAVSILVDIFQILLDLVPFAGWIVNILVDLLVGLIFWFWFKMLGVKFNNSSILISFVSGLVLNVIPFVGAFAWTLDVVLVSASVWAQEKSLAGMPGATGSRGRPQIKSAGPRKDMRSNSEVLEAARRHQRELRTDQNFSEV